ncbi:MAG: SDR family NAD(P)-dependent oxidoreductase [Planctomycetota bacterium]
MNAKGLRVLVTGGHKNIGQGIAKAFADAGARVAVMAQSAAAAESVARSLGTGAVGMAGDVRSDADWARVLESVTSAFGGLDCLVNNGGIETTKPLVDMGESEWDDLMDTNIKGVWRGVRQSVGHLAKSPRASIVNLASAAGHVAVPLMGAYGATKAAVMQMTRVLAVELRILKIRTNAVCPGFIDTEIGRSGFAPLESLGIPLEEMIAYRQGRLGRAEEVAEACVFLSHASFINGQCIFVDGGASAS